MLTWFELQKVWKNKICIFSTALLLLVNLFLLWTQSKPAAGTRQMDNAYRKLISDIYYMTMEEKIEYLQGYHDLIHAMYTIDQIERQAAMVGNTYFALLRQNNSDIYDEYYKTYQAGGFLRYMHDISAEYSFINSIYLEYQQVRDYPDFLTEIESKALWLGDILIFSDSGGYNSQNLKKTASDFSAMNIVKPNFFPQKGLYNATNLWMTNFVILLVQLFIAFTLIRNEMDTGILLLIRATKKGRWSTAAAKVMAMGISTLFVIIIFYGSNLLFCSSLFGLGNLNVPIQSYYFLMRSTLKCNVLEYIVLFMLTKWAAFFTIGLWVLLSCVLTKRAGTGYLLGIAFPIGCELLRLMIQPTSNFNLLRYANISSLVQTNELLGSYRNINILNKPTHIIIIEVTIALLCTIGFGSYFCLRLCGWQIQAVRTRKFKKRNSFLLSYYFSDLGWQETYKVMIAYGGILVLLAFLFIQGVLAYNAESYLTPDEIYYRHYINHMEGVLTQDKIDWFVEQGEEFRPIWELESAFRKGLINAQEYQSALSAYAGLMNKYIIYQQIYYELLTANNTPGNQMIYENGYRYLFGFDNQDNLLQCLLVCITLSIFCSPVFSLEKQNQMKRIITTTYSGRKESVIAKYRVAGYTVVSVCLISQLPELVIILRDYWFSALTAPLRSMNIFIDSPLNMPVFIFIILSFFVRIVGGLSVTAVILAVSEYIGNIIMTVIVSTIIFCLPPLLAINGLSVMQWFGVYPLFNFAPMMVTADNAAVGFLYLVGWMIIGGACIYWLFGRYQETMYIS